MPFPITLEGELQRRKLRKDYAAYVQYVNPRFHMTHFHKYLCDKIQEFINLPPTGKALDILMLSVPPQHGKSFTVTETLPSWYLGKNPTKSVIICSYMGEFAEAFNRRNRDKYNEFAVDIFGKDAAPNEHIQGVALWETAKGGRCRAGGLKGGITGYPADLFIIDDPIKNKEEAHSESIINRIHGEMVPSVQSRIHPSGKLIVIQTRWVENDVIGWIDSNWRDFVWQYINLPCECEDEKNDPLGRRIGDALIGEHLGDVDVPTDVRNDNAWLKSKKTLVCAGDGEYTWNALYQGHPTAAEGNLFRYEYFDTYSRENISVKDFDYLQLSIDASFKQTETSDFVAIGLWGMQQQHAFLYKLVNKRMDFISTMHMIHRFTRDYPTIDEMVIEDKANGSAIINTLNNEPDNVPPVVPINPLGGKYSRAQAVAPYVEQRKVHIPCDFTEDELREIEYDGANPDLCNGTQRYLEQLTHFPFAKHDDMVDMTTQALTRLIRIASGDEQPPEKRHYLVYVKWYPDMWEDYNHMNEQQQIQFVRKYGAPLEWQEFDD